MSKRAPLDTSCYQWYRFYHEMLSRPQVRSLTDFELRVFIACMCLASKSPGEDRFTGALTIAPTGEPLPISEIVIEVHTGDEAAVAKALAVLQAKGLISRRDDGAYRIDFMWQQYPGDSSTPRSRKSRAKHSPDACKTQPPSMPNQTTTEENRAEQSATLQSPPPLPDRVLSERVPEASGLDLDERMLP